MKPPSCTWIAGSNWDWSKLGLSNTLVPPLLKDPNLASKDPFEFDTKPEAAVDKDDFIVKETFGTLGGCDWWIIVLAVRVTTDANRLVF